MSSDDREDDECLGSLLLQVPEQSFKKDSTELLIPPSESPELPETKSNMILFMGPEGTTPFVPSEGVLRSNRKPSSTSSHREYLREKQVSHYKGYVKLCLSGVIFITIGSIFHAIDIEQVVKNFVLDISFNSILMFFWQDPPIRVYYKLYLFNYTNSEEFIKGYDDKMKVTEVGPYVYRDLILHENVAYHDNGTMSYTPRHIVEFIRSKSVGDVRDDMLITPNAPLIGMASKLHKSSAALSFGLNTLAAYLDAKPFIMHDIHSYLWGYNDTLVTYAAKFLPSWIDFKTFGLLDRILNEGENVVTVKSNKENSFEIESINGVQGLKEWGYVHNETDTKNRCNTFNGSVYDGLTYPRRSAAENRAHGFRVYRKAFCRNIPLEFSRASTRYSVPVDVYVMPLDIYNGSAPDNTCFCETSESGCTPVGVSDVSPCYYNIPVSMSHPHFFQGDPGLRSKFVGLEPDSEKHMTTAEIQPELGVVLKGQARIQINLNVNRIKYVTRVKKFSSTVIPLFWVEMANDDYPDWLIFGIHSLLIVWPIGIKIITILLFVIGFLLVLIANLRYAWANGLHNASAIFISNRKKRRHSVHRGSTRRPSMQELRRLSRRYSQLVPLPPHELVRAR